MTAKAMAILLAAAALGLMGCHRPAEDCLSKTELTARIAGQTYVFPSKDKPQATARRENDLFWISPSERSDGDLMACQAKETDPVYLRDLAIAPASLKPDVVQFSIDNTQLEARALPSMAEALAGPWVENYRTASADSIELRTAEGQLVASGCSPRDWKDVSGHPIPVMCEMRIRLEPHGALRLQYRQPNGPAEARQILKRVEEYLQSRMVKPRA